MDRRVFVPLWAALAFTGCAALVAGAFEAGASIWSEVTAAWVQAIGSLATIGWAFWLYIDERSKRLAAAQDTRLSVIRAATAATQYASDQIKELIGRTYVDPLWFERLEWAGELLREVPVLQADDNEVIDMVVAARSRLKQAERQAKRVNSSGELDPGPLGDAQRQIKTLHAKVAADLRRIAAKYSVGPHSH